MPTSPLFVAVALVVSLASLCQAQVANESTARFLGKDLATWKRQLASDEASSRHEAAWALAQMGTTARWELLVTAKHPDQVVRFWSAQGLEKLLRAADGDDADKHLVHKQLLALLQDKAAAPRLAAADVLARNGSLAAAMPVLIAGLSDPQESVGIQAATTLRALGKQAAPARAKLEQAQEQGEEYVKRLATQSLQQLKD